jgi:WD40 repeat protein
MCLAWSTLSAAQEPSGQVPISDATVLSSDNRWFTSLAFSSDGSTLVAVENTRTPTDMLGSRPRFRGRFLIFNVTNNQSTDRLIPAKKENYTRVIQVSGSLGDRLSEDDVISVVGPEPLHQQSWLNGEIQRRHFEVRLEGVKSQQVLASFPNVQDMATVSLAISPSRKLIAFCSGGAFDKDEKNVLGRVEIWNIETGKAVLQQKSEQVMFSAITFNRDGSRFAVGGDYRTYGAFLRDPQHLYGGYQDGFIAIRDTTTGEDVCSIPRLPAMDGSPRRNVESVVFSVDDRFLVTGESSGTITWWDASTGKEVRAVQMARPARSKGERLATTRVLSLTYPRFGRFLFVGLGSYNRGGMWGALRVIDDETGNIAKVLLEKHPEPVHCVTISPDGKHLAAATGDGSIILWSIR